MSSLPKVRATGDFFSNEDGSEFRYLGFSDFGQFKRMNIDQGPEALVRPIWAERRSIANAAGWTRPLVARVFRYSDPGNTFGILPSHVNFDLIDPFISMAAEYNIYIDWTCGDSDHAVMGFSGVADYQNWLNTFCSRVTKFCFMETCNEPFKNGNLPKLGVVPPSSPWYIRDSGDYGDIGNPNLPWPYNSNLDFCSYHGDRTQDHPRWPKWVMDLPNQLGTMRSHLYKPSVLKEPNKFGPYYQDPIYAKILGTMILLGGVTFHSQLGLQSDGFDDSHKQAFGMFCQAAAGVV